MSSSHPTQQYLVLCIDSTLGFSVQPDKACGEAMSGEVCRFPSHTADYQCEWVGRRLATYIVPPTVPVSNIVSRITQVVSEINADFHRVHSTPRRCRDQVRREPPAIHRHSRAKKMVNF